MKKIPKFNSIRMLAIQIGLGYASLLIALALVSYIIHQGNESMDASQAETRKIEEVRSAIHSIHYKLTELTLLGENVMEWDEHDYKQYHDKRMLLDSTLALFEEKYKDTVPESPIDTVRQLFSQKEKLLMNIMETMGKQDSVNQELLKRLPSITRAATNNEQKKKGGMFSFLKKKKKQPVATSSMLYTLDKDVVQKQNAYKEQLETLIDSLTICNVELNKQLELFIEVLWNESEYQMAEKARNNQKMRDETYKKTVNLLIAALVIFSLSCMVLHWSLLRRKRAERGLAEANKDIKRLLAEREKMIYSISHDIKGPLGVITNNADMIRSKDDCESNFKRLDYIRHAGAQIGILINTLLDFSKLNQGKEVVHHEAFNLEKLLGETADVQRQMAQNKDLKFTLNLKGCDKTVKGDAVKLNRIITNLVNNAIKFTKTGGITFVCEYKDAVLNVNIQDTGIGMTPDEVERIFLPYESKINEQNSNGLGLGMYIAKKLVELLNGKIEVQSIVGKGTSVTVFIPLEETDEEPVNGENAVKSVGKTLNGISVLAIDDDKLQLATMKERLEMCGAECDTCTEVTQLADLMRNRHYDVLFTDIQMGDYDGFKVLALLRNSNIGNSNTIPIVAMTARSEKTRGDFQKDGFTDCIHKPFNADDLTKVVSGIVEREETTIHFDRLLAGVSNQKMILGLLIESNNELSESIVTAIDSKNEEAVREIIHKHLPLWAEIGCDIPLARLQNQVKADSDVDWDNAKRLSDDVYALAKEINRRVLNKLAAV